MSSIVPFTVSVIKIKYCELNQHKCERYKLKQKFTGIELPYNLWPNDEMHALEILEDKLNETRKRVYGPGRAVVI